MAPGPKFRYRPSQRRTRAARFSRRAPFRAYPGPTPRARQEPSARWPGAAVALKFRMFEGEPAESRGARSITKHLRQASVPAPAPVVPSGLMQKFFAGPLLNCERHRDLGGEPPPEGRYRRPPSPGKVGRGAGRIAWPRRRLVDPPPPLTTRILAGCVWRVDGSSLDVDMARQ